MIKKDALESASYLAIKYNNRGRAFEKTSTIDSQPFTLSRTFTPAGRISHMTYPTGRIMDFTLNDCNCSTRKVETSYNAVTTILSDNLEYRPFGQSKGMTRPNADNTDSTVANQYDLAGRITTANPGAPKERSFTFDANGNLESVTSTGTPWYNRTFTYNALNQLTGATGPFGNGTIGYTYDDVYNRQTQTMSGITDTYNYASGTSRMSSVVSSWNDGITGAPMEETVSNTHDANGNTTAKGSRTFTYNQNNQLVKAEEGATVLGQYQYNGVGQRVKKTAGGVTTWFIYDFLDNLVTESDGTGTIHTEYLYRGSARLAKVDISQSGSAELYYYMNDRLGTPEALIDQNETVVWEAVYKPFGEADVHPASSIVNNLRLPGQYYDSETGLHFNYYRYYDPGIGRYLTPDPIGLAGGINLYAYVLNNPIRNTDPFGLDPGDSFPSADAAAIDAIDYINQTSIAEDREYIGWIYKELFFNSYSYTEPLPGERTSATITERLFGAEAIYHTHGDDNPDQDDENFSPTDKKTGYTTYLGTPSNAIKKYDPNSGETTLRNKCE